MTSTKSGNMKYVKNGKEIEYFFLTDEQIESEEYKDFIHSDEFRAFMHTPDGDLYSKRKKRIDNYKAFYDLKILCVRVDGVISGQSCAFKDYAIVNGERKEFWWSIDTFLMTKCRGLGIGKNLQKILHDELPNFSSAWYTPINGIVKKKCGAHGLFDFWFCYYPVSSCLGVFADLSFRKLFKRPSPIRTSIPRLYSFLNSLFIDTKLKQYTVSEIPYDMLGTEESEFMEGALSKYNFHIERSFLFLKWKYKSLKAGYHMLKFEKAGKTEAIIAFSNIYDSKFDAAPIKGVTIYDTVISPSSKLTVKQLMLFIVRWYKQQHQCFDGFQSLEKFFYIGRLVYPFKASPLLSTMTADTKTGYLTYADQDMDQI